MGADRPPNSREAPMRCRTEAQVPKCFKGISCPYPTASTVHGMYGAINYGLVGPPGGEIVVCLHGLNGSRMLFQDLGEHLAKAGFRCLSFDLYGHGLSNAPKVDLCPCKGYGRCSEAATCGSQRGRYDLDFFIEQTDDILALLGMENECINLVGFSLGGTIAVAFAQRYPSRVARLVAMSPAGFLPKVPWAYYLLQAVWCCLIPMAPHVLCTCWYKKERFTKSFKGDNQDVDPEVVHNLWKRFVWQLFVKRGVASATLAVCHRVPWFSMKPLFNDCGKSERPVLLVWGEKDSLNPPQTVAPEVKKCFSNVHLVVIPGAGHISICDKPRQTIVSIVNFLKLPADTRMSNVDVLAPPRSAPVPRMMRVAGAAGDSDNQDDSWNNEMRDSLASSSGAYESGDERRLAAASQMPVPMVLGHRDAGQDQAASSSKQDDLSRAPSYTVL